MTLREHLEAMDGALYERLETSWEIAQNEWIPTLKMDSESHSGLPHLQSVEARMNRIAQECQPIWSRHSEVPFGFNALEVYLALASALLHDVGRGVPCSDHGAESARIVSQHWAKLGVVSQRVADELAPIIEFHTSGGKWLKHDSVVTIHPWGIIHSEAIAALLCLADELDTAYDRVVPPYMRGTLSTAPEVDLAQLERESYCTKGLWRDFISDVDLAPGSRLIKTVVFSSKLPGKNKEPHRNAADGTSGSTSIDRFSSAISSLSRLDDFRPEDYFYLFLQYMPETVGSQIVSYLSEQYQDLDQFGRLSKLGKLHLPEPDGSISGRDLRFLVRNYQSWSREPIDPQSPRCQMRRSYEALSDAIGAVLEYITYAGKELDREDAVQVQWPQQCKELVARSINCRAMWLLREHLTAVEHQLPEVDYSEKMGRVAKIGSAETTNERQEAFEAVARKSSDNDQADYASEDTKKIADFLDRVQKVVSAQEPDKVLKLKDAHQLAVAVLSCMLDMDLSRPSPSFEARRWESYEFQELHTNLLLAFAVYLSTVRRLLKIKEERQYHSEALGKLEGASTLVRDLLEQYVPEVIQCEATDTAPPSPDFAKELTERLERFLEANQDRGGKHRIRRAELDYAASWMFMRWLSRDVADKNRKLHRIRPGLRKIEIPFEEWRIEYESYLFDDRWNLCLEPSLTKSFLKELIERAYYLSTGVIQRELELPWDSLAAAVREPNLELVKSAAIRLSNLLRLYTQGGDTEKGTLHFGDILRAQLKGGKPKANLQTSFSSWSLNGCSEDELGKLNALIDRIDAAS